MTGGVQECIDPHSSTTAWIWAAFKHNEPAVSFGHGCITKPILVVCLMIIKVKVGVLDWNMGRFGPVVLVWTRQTGMSEGCNLVVYFDRERERI